MLVKLDPSRAKKNKKLKTLPSFVVSFGTGGIKKTVKAEDGLG